MKRIARAAAVIVAVFVGTSQARAADPGAALDAPAPPTLPALAHPSLTYTLEYTVAGIAPVDAAPGVGRAYAWFAHNEIEMPLVPRVWYLGAAHDIVAGAVPHVGHDFFFGNPELWGRGLWSSFAGLSSGAGFGVVLPLPRRLSREQQLIFQTVRVVRPWDAAYFTDRTITLRPWIDVRHIAGRFIFQLRQGLDVSIAVRDLEPHERRTDYVARTAFYAGFRLAKPIGIGIEVWEVYQITADLPDDKRAAFAISPSVRLLLGRVSPAFSVLLPITTPLRGEAASYFAARFNVGFDFDTPRSRAAAQPHEAPGR